MKITISAVTEAAGDATSVFNKENGKRHRQLDALRKAGKSDSPEFKKLYNEERAWLQQKGIVFNPSSKRWEFRKKGGSMR